MEKSIKFSKLKLDKIYKECIDLVKSRRKIDFCLKKLKGSAGICHDDLIEFDYRRDIVPTMFHECIHFLYPEWSETKVLIAEKRLINHLTTLQISYFLKEISNKIFKSELKMLNQ